MAFTLPTFNLSVDVYTGPWLGKVFRLATPGNLAVSKRTMRQSEDIPAPGVDQYSPVPILLVPALTDLRWTLHSPSYDVLEIPSGSGRWYAVQCVEDIGKGFPNEHRYAEVTQIDQRRSTAFAGCVWPIPMP